MTIELGLENKHFSDLNPIICGSERCESRHSYGPAIRKYYLIHYVVTGKGYFYINNEKLIVNDGECFLIKPNQVTTYTADEKNPWYYIWIGFDGKLAERFSDLPPVFKFNSFVFNELFRANNIASTREEFLAGKLFTIYSEIFSDKKNSNYVEIAENYIQSSYMQKISVSEIAKMLNLDRHYLTRLFKAKTGKPLKEYLIDIRMSEAATLLKNGHTVTETCYMVGYEDIFTFSKAFKKHFGCPPSKNL